MIVDHYLKHNKNSHYDYRKLPEAKALALIILDLQAEIKFHKRARLEVSHRETKEGPQLKKHNFKTHPRYQ
jgi:hypothetical protein